MGLHMLIAESRQVQRQLLCSIYSSCPLVGCIDDATNREELGEKLATIFPDFVVVHQSLITDISLLPKGHFVIVATEPDKDILIAAYNQGARGYFLDNPLPPTTFLITCLELQGRQCSLGPTAASWLLEYIAQNEVSTLNGVLTAHERNILALWNTGLSSRAIGEQGIQDYHLVPSLLEKKLAMSALLSICFPIAELLAGMGLVTGFWLIPATVLALVLFVVFSVAITINLARGRHDLSCHCGGAIGNHLISWWLVGRNGLLIFSLLVLLVTPPDSFTVPSFVRSPSLLNPSFVSIIVPVAVLVGAILAALALFNASRVLWRS